MRKLLALAGVLLLATTGAVLAEPFQGNIQQKDTGTVWIDQSGDTAPVGGGSFLTVEIEDLSTAATDFVVVHKPGRIVRAYITHSVALGTAAANVDFLISDGNSSTSFTAVTDGDQLVVPISGLGSHAGGMTEFVTDTSVGHTVDVDRGDVIAVTTDGASTNASKGWVTIVIE